MRQIGNVGHCLTDARIDVDQASVDLPALTRPAT
jgi:hypothetical protein